MLTGQSSATALPPTPALFTRLSTAPACSKISAKPRVTESSSATSSTTSFTSTPASAAIAWSFVALSRERTVPYTSWPCAERWMAVARPIPEFAPVTTDTGLTPVIVSAERCEVAARQPARRGGVRVPGLERRREERDVHGREQLRTGRRIDLEPQRLAHVAVPAQAGAARLEVGVERGEGAHVG